MTTHAVSEQMRASDMVMDTDRGAGLAMLR
jgi:hypothetical protein